MGDGRHFKCSFQSDRDEYLHDRLSLYPKGCIQGHVTSLKFRKISNNMSETVHDSDIVTME